MISYTQDRQLRRSKFAPRLTHFCASVCPSFEFDFGVMPLSTRSRSQHCKQHQRCKAASFGSTTCPKLLIAFAVALGSLVGGSAASTASHRFRFLPGRGPAPVLVSEPPTLGQRFKGLGGRVRSGLGGFSMGRGVSAEGERKVVMAGVGATSKGRDASSGNGANVGGNGGNKANGNRNGNGGLNSFLAGGLAGSISTTITCPIEVGLWCCFCRRTPTSVGGSVQRCLAQSLNETTWLALLLLRTWNIAVQACTRTTAL